MGSNMYLYEKAREAQSRTFSARWQRADCERICLGII
jgi:hypothetical protein